ncbi:unnamed protein product [Rhizophagus irregularis]|nr:unnamed protein product [Rhizophagus irregularis]
MSKYRKELGEADIINSLHKNERRGQGLKTYWEKLIREYSSVNENQQKNAQWITILHHLHTKKEFVQNEDDGDVILELEM